MVQRKKPTALAFLSKKTVKVKITYLFMSGTDLVCTLNTVAYSQLPITIGSITCELCLRWCSLGS